MEILVGVTQDQQGEDAIALGLALGKTQGVKVTIAHIFPSAFDFVSAAHVDAEWRKYLREEAQEVLDWAKEKVDGRAEVEYTMLGNKSSGVGLHQLASERGSGVIVIGSAPGSSDGRIAIGSTANQLFHESPIPVSVAPIGYSNWAPEQIARVVLAYREGTGLLQALVTQVQAVADPESMGVKVITVLDEPSHFKRLGSRSSGKGESLLDTLRKQANERLELAADEIHRELGHRAETEVIEADGFGHAISRFSFDDGDLLMMGTPKSAPIKRVFLSDVTYTMIRSATVPVIVSPMRS